ncbi:unnamed protein product, partial [Thlaspi arvense]
MSEVPHSMEQEKFSGKLERTGKRVLTWNTNAYGYGSGTTSLYQSHPWVLAVFPSGEALGVLADTTRRCEIDLREGSTIKFVAPQSYPVITFGPFASPTDVLVSLSHAVGTVFMPQSGHWDIINVVGAITQRLEFVSHYLHSKHFVPLSPLPYCLLIYYRLQIAKTFRQKGILVMSFGWTLITWMVFVVSLLTRHVLIR